MADWIASLLRGFTMVVLPIAAFVVGIAVVDLHDDSLRKAVISKTWSSTQATTDDKSPTEDKGGKPEDTQGAAASAATPKTDLPNTEAAKTVEKKKPQPDRKDSDG